MNIISRAKTANHHEDKKPPAKNSGWKGREKRNPWKYDGLWLTYPEPTHPSFVDQNTRHVLSGHELSSPVLIAEAFSEWHFLTESVRRVAASPWSEEGSASSPPASGRKGTGNPQATRGEKGEMIQKGMICVVSA